MTATLPPEETGHFRIAPDLVVGPEDDRGRRTVGVQSTRRYFRLPVVLFDALQGHAESATEDEWVSRLGPDVVRRLIDGHLLVPVSEATPKRTHRILVRRWSSIQFTLWNPDRFLSRLSQGTRAVPLRALAVTTIVLTVVGLGIGTVVHPVSPARLVASQPPTFALALLIGLWASTWIHELAHGYVLKRYGGDVPRMGVMLFYLVPAAFCDITDAWRITDRVQRASVAAAGAAAQCWIGGLTAVAGVCADAWMPGEPIAATALFAFSWVMFGAAAWNLVPFCRLDGYWVLTALVDRGNVAKHASAQLSRLAHGDKERGVVVWALYAVCTGVFRVFLLFIALGFYMGMTNQEPPGATAAALIASGTAVFTVVRSARAGVARA